MNTLLLASLSDSLSLSLVVLTQPLLTYFTILFALLLLHLMLFFFFSFTGLFLLFFCYFFILRQPFTQEVYALSPLTFTFLLPSSLLPRCLFSSSRSSFLPPLARLSTLHFFLSTFSLSLYLFSAVRQICFCQCKYDLSFPSAPIYRWRCIVTRVTSIFRNAINFFLSLSPLVVRCTIQRVTQQNDTNFYYCYSLSHRNRLCNFLFHCLFSLRFTSLVMTFIYLWLKYAPYFHQSTRK